MTCCGLCGGNEIVLSKGDDHPPQIIQSEGLNRCLERCKGFSASKEKAKKK